MVDEYDVIIVGAGPAGMFAAMALAGTGRRLLMLEKGYPLEGRNCPGRGGRCLHCRPCAVMNGWGGAGAFSDGKLTLSSNFGGLLPAYVGAAKTEELISRVDNIFCTYGAPPNIFGSDSSFLNELQRQAAAAGLELVPAKIRHLGTDNCLQILRAISQYLSDKVDCRFRSPVQELLVEKNKIRGVQLENGESIKASYVICGPGREGALWLLNEARRLNLTISNNPVDIGIDLRGQSLNLRFPWNVPRPSPRKAKSRQSLPPVSAAGYNLFLPPGEFCYPIF